MKVTIHITHHPKRWTHNGVQARTYTLDVSLRRANGSPIWEVFKIRATPPLPRMTPKQLTDLQFVIEEAVKCATGITEVWCRLGAIAAATTGG